MVICIQVVFLGIVGVAKENYCALLTFCITLGILVVIQIGVAISFFALIRHNKFESLFGSTMRSSLEHFEQDGYDGVTKGEELFLKSFVNSCTGAFFNAVHTA